MANLIKTYLGSRADRLIRKITISNKKEINKHGYTATSQLAVRTSPSYFPIETKTFTLNVSSNMSLAF